MNWYVQGKFGFPNTANLSNLKFHVKHVRQTIPAKRKEKKERHAQTGNMTAVIKTICVHGKLDSFSLLS